MMERKSSEPQTAREEDYRDYDKRNIGDGWPYADEDGLPAERNAPYGTTGSNLDESGRVGVEIADRPEIASHGGPSVFPAAETAVIEDDVLEEAIADMLSRDEDIDPSMITVTVHGGIVTLSGEVETAQARNSAFSACLAVKGVRACRNELVLIGLDSHIPSDSDI